jgi:hypothetical protein
MGRKQSKWVEYLMKPGGRITDEVGRAIETVNLTRETTDRKEKSRKTDHQNNSTNEESEIINGQNNRTSKQNKITSGQINRHVDIIIGPVDKITYEVGRITEPMNRIK